MIFEFLKRFDRDESHVIYIASDSKDVKLLAQKHLESCVYVNRTIIHVDKLGQYSKSGTTACKGLYTALFEQFILTTCDTLILTKSGFSTMAAYSRGLSSRLFLYHPETREIIRTNITNIQMIFRHV